MGNTWRAAGLGLILVLVAAAFPGLPAAASAPEVTSASFDENVTAWSDATLRGPTGDSLFNPITFLGDGRTAALLIGLTAARGDRQLAADEFSAVALAGSTTLLLKWAVGRARPYTGAGAASFAPASGRADWVSFPSGHTAVAFALARVLAKRYPDQAVLYYAAAGLVGFSRIYLHEHWATDVAAGAIVGLAAGDHGPELPMLKVSF